MSTKLSKLTYAKWFNVKFKSMLSYVKQIKRDPFLLANIETISKYYEDTCPVIVNLFIDTILPEKELTKNIKSKNYTFFINYINNDNNKYKNNSIYKKLHNIFSKIDKTEQKKLMCYVDDLRKLSIHYNKA
jgi:hypothetical protein